MSYIKKKIVTLILTHGLSTMVHFSWFILWHWQYFRLHSGHGITKVLSWHLLRGTGVNYESRQSRQSMTHLRFKLDTLWIQVYSITTNQPVQYYNVGMISDMNQK